MWCRYNHHHDVYLTGKHSHMEKVRYDPLDLTIPLMARADPEFLDLPKEHSPSPDNLPTSLHLAGKTGDHLCTWIDGCLG